jgi:cytochrome c-type biogenesis protein
MNPFDISYAAALLAGALSFLSPCILPLVPAYLCFVGGASLEEFAGPHADAATGRRVLVSALAFVGGFVSIFVVLGATATSLSRLLSEHFDLLGKVAGTVIILFGLHYAGVLRIPLLNREMRYHASSRRAGLVGSFLVGLAFAFGWTPCVGPVLATILMVAGSAESVWRGTALLACYGIGLGLPFLLAAAAIRPFLRAASRLRRYVRWVEVSLGAMMVATGALILLGSVSEISGWLLDNFPALARVG